MEERKKKRREIEELVKRVILLMAQQNYQEAFPLLKEAKILGKELKIRRNELGKIINEYGTCLYKTGQFKEAQKEFKGAVELLKGGDKVGAIYNLALSIREEAISEQREDLFLKEISHLEKAEKELLQLWQRKKISREKFKELAAIIYNELGCVHSELNKFSEAAENYRKALKFNKFDPEIEINLATAKLEEAVILKSSGGDQKIVEEKIDEVIQISRPYLSDLSEEEIERKLRVKGISILMAAYCLKSENELAKIVYQELGKITKDNLPMEYIFQCARTSELIENFKEAIWWFKEWLRCFLRKKGIVAEEIEIPEMVKKLEKLGEAEIGEIGKFLPDFGSLILIEGETEKKYRVAESLLKLGLTFEETPEGKAMIFYDLAVCQLEIAKIERNLETGQKAIEYLEKSKEYGFEKEKIKALEDAIIKVSGEIKEEEKPIEIAISPKKEIKEKKWLKEEEVIEEKIRRAFNGRPLKKKRRRP